MNNEQSGQAVWPTNHCELHVAQYIQCNFFTREVASAYIHVAVLVIIKTRI